MQIVGCGFNTRYQQIVRLDEETASRSNATRRASDSPLL